VGLAIFALTCALGAISTVFDFNRGGMLFYIYAASAAAGVRPAAAWLMIGAALLLAVGSSFVPDMAADARIAWLTPVLVLIVVVGTMRILDAERRRSTDRLQMAHWEVERLAAVAERERIGRDLHDLLGHTLSMVTLKSELASKLVADDPARATKEIKEVEGISRKALREVRQAVRGYLDTGLAGELASARMALTSAKIEHRIDTQNIGELPKAPETVVALALREAVTNIVRHARATRVRGRIGAAGDDIVLSLSDNGQGGIIREGNGLRGIRQRVAALGGEFSYESRNGTTLTVRVPLSPPSVEPVPAAPADVPLSLQAS
jgi:two-component system sensor histidine kinase DesK